MYVINSPTSYSSFLIQTMLSIVCMTLLVPSTLAQRTEQKPVVPSPTEMAAYQGDTKEILRLLNDGFDVNHVDTNGFTLLSGAVAGNQFELVKLLLAKGAEPNADKGASMLSAADKDSVKILRCLLEAGGNPNARFGDMMNTPLIVANQNCNTAAVTLLLDKGADPNLQNNLGWSPLMLAASGSCKMAPILIAHGAHVNAKDRYGMTALMGAALWGKLDGVRLLLQAGADPNMADEDGVTALDYAKKGGFKEIVTLLRDAETKQRLNKKPTSPH